MHLDDMRSYNPDLSISIINDDSIRCRNLFQKSILPFHDKMYLIVGLTRPGAVVGFGAWIIPVGTTILISIFVGSIETTAIFEVS